MCLLPAYTDATHVPAHHAACGSNHIALITASGNRMLHAPRAHPLAEVIGEALGRGGRERRVAGDVWEHCFAVIKPGAAVRQSGFASGRSGKRPTGGWGGGWGFGGGGYRLGGGEYRLGNTADPVVFPQRRIRANIAARSLPVHGWPLVCIIGFYGRHMHACNACI